MARETVLYDQTEAPERLIVVGVDLENSVLDVEASLDELEELAQTAGAEIVGRVVQKREGIHPGFYVGSGKLEELAAAVKELDADGVLCDDELSPSQLRNLSDKLDCKVLDRTMLILDIFAGRARSSEGKLQVELAQLQYRLTRLTGMGKAMSRLGGGIGTRGPGEKKLETDRRYIKDRIADLNRSLREMETHRQVLRSGRERRGLPVVSLVGYTNAGKSTLLNALTGAGVLAEDKLFATLDTTTRQVALPSGGGMLLTDTVGFIQKLPHHLVRAFRATLDEMKYADLLIHVVDASNPLREQQMEVVYSTLKDLGCENTPVITVFNKMDREIELPLPYDAHAAATCRIAAAQGEGLPKFLAVVEEVLASFRKPITLLIPYAEGGVLNLLYQRAEVQSAEHEAEGTRVTALVEPELARRLEAYQIEGTGESV